jgi:Zn-dependent protease
MFGWSINLFRIRGIRISLHWTFAVMLLYECNEGWKLAGVPGLLWSGGTFLAFFTCVVLHELGHSLTAIRFGVNVRRILLTPIGGIAEFDRIPRKPSQELLITAAGPAVNFVIAALLMFVVRLPQGPDDGDTATSLMELCQILLRWNLIMGLFNLIPAFPMDGGRILRAFLAMRLTYLRATYWAANVGKAITVGGFVWELLKGPRADLFIIAICVFIFTAGQAEYVAVKRREDEEAQWRESLIRRMVPPPTPGPPVL